MQAACDRRSNTASLLSRSNLAGCGKRGEARDNARPAAAEWATRGPRGAAAWGSGRSPV